MSDHGDAATGPDSEEFTVAQDGEYDAAQEPVDDDERPLDDEPDAAFPDEERRVVLDDPAEAPEEAD